MSILITILRSIAAILLPLSAMWLTLLTFRHAKKTHQTGQASVLTCARCDQSRPGANGVFAYSKDAASLRAQMKDPQAVTEPASLEGPEVHFICDQCARRYLRGELTLQVLVVLPYPLYLVVSLIFPFSNFLLEIGLALLAFAGAASAVNLYRAVWAGETSLAEARDRAAIQMRKRALGKNISYYTRTGMRQREK